MAQEQELLDPNLSALQTIQSVAHFNETEARNFLHYFLFEDDDPLRPTRDLSYGERSRLQLGYLVAQGCTFLLLDEPMASLDPSAREEFAADLIRLRDDGLYSIFYILFFISRCCDEDVIRINNILKSFHKNPNL